MTGSGPGRYAETGQPPVPEGRVGAWAFRFRSSIRSCLEWMSMVLMNATKSDYIIR